MRGNLNCETIKMMRKSFSRFGVPKLLVSDNAPQFVSEECNDWLSNIGVKHLYSPPYHPASNGRAERAVRAFKERELKCITDFQKRMDNILVALNSGSCADLKLYGRKLWSPVVTKTSFVPALHAYTNHNDGTCTTCTPKDYKRRLGQDAMSYPIVGQPFQMVLS